MWKKCVLAAALTLVLVPASARADWLFTPFVGTTFGGDASGNEHFTYGAQIGWMGAGIIGWEADFSYTPNFFEVGNDDALDPVGDSNVITAMGNVLIGVPIGGQTGGGFRPYVTGGIGLMRQKVEDTNQLFSIDNNDWGFNLGVGAMGFATDHVGFRGDVRYLRSFEDISGDLNLEAGKFHYWRGTGGVVFRW